ncbi:hypothetical protein QP519_01995 [Weeksella virosa]|uniref:hypothetical protein n=2 Tax=Weeksella virosa TaxID=1014 RepID=UPI002556A49C|nr:hypothetical protein [Weeksella virosa]MDK7374319.1 hypothetical protein [Weeksella virosa]
MHRKNIIVLIVLLVAGSLYAQVGINTDNPQQLFHVDGKIDNPPTDSPSTDQQKNDVVITADGQLGIGTTLPSESLDVNGGVRIRVLDSIPDPKAIPIYIDENGLVGMADFTKVATFIVSDKNYVVEPGPFNSGTPYILPINSDDLKKNTLKVTTSSNNAIIPEDGVYLISSSVAARLLFNPADTQKYGYIAFSIDIKRNGESTWTTVSGGRKTFFRVTNPLEDNYTIPTAIVRLDSGSSVRVKMFRTKDSSGNLQGASILTSYIGGVNRHRGFTLNIKKLNE